MAACGARHAAAWRGWIVASNPPTARLRDFRRGLGERDSSAAHREVYAGMAGSTVPVRRSDVGTAVATSGLREQRAAACAADARGADFSVPAAGCGMVGGSAERCRSYAVACYWGDTGGD